MIKTLNWEKMTFKIVFFYTIWTNGWTAFKILILECINQLMISYTRADFIILIQKLTAFNRLRLFLSLELGFPLFTHGVLNQSQTFKSPWDNQNNCHIAVFLSALPRSKVWRHLLLTTISRLLEMLESF